MESMGCATVGEKPKRISADLNRLSECIENAQGRVSLLENALAGILEEVPPRQPAPNDDRQGDGLADILEGFVGRVDAIVIQLTEIHDRLEL